jgi:hypothetical protein
MKLTFLFICLSFSISAFAGPAVLIEENGTAVQNTQQKESRIQPLSQRKSLRDIYENQEFDYALDLRAKRRVGVGAMTAGSTGLLGALVELNFTPENSVITAFGGGTGFNSFNFQWKHVFGGQTFSPYAGVGYARWYSASGSGENLEKTTPSLLAGKFLSEEEKRTGRFAVDLITPTLGIQYNQLFGPYVGTAVFAEITFLTDVSDLSPVPTGGLGALYYF